MNVDRIEFGQNIERERIPITDLGVGIDKGCRVGYVRRRHIKSQEGGIAGQARYIALAAGNQRNFAGHIVRGRQDQKGEVRADLQVTDRDQRRIIVDFQLNAVNTGFRHILGDGINAEGLPSVNSRRA